MNKKEAYKQKNEEYMETLKNEEGIQSLPNGVMYRVMKQGTGEGEVGFRSRVTCNYRGSLINGYVFDDSWRRGHPESFRANELIGGFSAALRAMHIGDHWMVYIPYTEGYGTRSDGDIPGCSTLIFEIELLKIE